MSEELKVTREKGKWEASFKLDIVAIVLALLGALASGAYTKASSNQSELGYEVLAGIVNRSVLDRLDAIESRLAALEKERKAVLPPMKAVPLTVERRDALRGAPASMPVRAPLRLRDVKAH